VRLKPPAPLDQLSDASERRSGASYMRTVCSWSIAVVHSAAETRGIQRQPRERFARVPFPARTAGAFLFWIGFKSRSKASALAGVTAAVSAVP
jgi:hypothetical protein